MNVMLSLLVSLCKDTDQQVVKNHRFATVATVTFVTDMGFGSIRQDNAEIY